jgi:hypothetical protein
VTPRDRRLRLAVVLAGMAMLVLAVVAGVHAAGGTRSVTGDAVPLVNVGSVPAAGAAGGPRPSSHPGVVVRPGTVLEIARLGVRAPVVTVSAPGGEMQIPRDPRVVGWWTDGARPGGSAGHAVIVGHVNYAGVSGALGVLPELKPGDLVTVDVPGSPAISYRIAALRSYPKSAGLPDGLFSTDGPPELVLITCGGTFDSSTGNYEDNIVAFASPLG